MKIVFCVNYLSIFKFDKPKYCSVALDGNNIAVVYAHGKMNIRKFHVFK